MAKRTNDIDDRYARPVPGVRVDVYNADNTLVICTDDLGAPLNTDAHPILSDAAGVYTYNASPGVYRESYTKGGTRIAPDDPDVVVAGPDFAGKFQSWDAEGNLVPSSGTGSDPALRTDLAASSGSTLAGWKQSGTASATLSVQTKLRRNLDTGDKTGGLLAAFNALGTDLDAGGAFRVLPGVNVLSDTWTFTGQRINVNGDGPNVSYVSFDPATAKAALVLNTAALGGQYQSGITNLGFTSNNSVDKTAIRLVNAANIQVERIGIAGGGWLGSGSIGIRTEGRQFIRIRDCEIATARPVVIGPNATFTSLAGDYTEITSCELQSDSTTAACVEVENGAILSNFAIRNTALVKGQDAFRYLDTSSAIQPNANWQFENIRTEQGTDPAGWSFNISSTNNPVQSIMFSNIRLDNGRNGIKLRNCLRITLVNVDLDQVGTKTLLDIVGVSGTVLTLINCWGQTGGVLSLTNMKRVTGVRSAVASPIGPFEQWVYDAGEVFTEDNSWKGSKPFTLANNATTTICSNACAGFIEVFASNFVGAKFFLGGTNNAAFENLDPSGQFSATLGNASTTNIAYSGGNYVIENKSGGSLSYRIERTGPGSAGFTS